MDDVPAAGWDLLVHSEIGANHVQRGIENQDAAHVESLQESVVLCVADGHGSNRYVRSDVGSRLATEVFTALAKEFLEAARPAQLGAMKSAAEFTMPRQIEARWKEAVTADLVAHPLLGSADQRDDKRGWEDSDDFPEAAERSVVPRRDIVPADDAAAQILVYGTTLVGAVIAGDFIVVWQIGDGDVLFVDADGSVTTPLAPEAPELGGLETDSLCQPDAWSFVRVHWRRLGSDSLRLVLLSTDGLANSFTDRNAFLEFGRGVLARINEVGVEAARHQLPSWLKEATSYSGDDVSLVGAWLRPVPAPHASEAGGSGAS